MANDSVAANDSRHPESQHQSQSKKVSQPSAVRRSHHSSKTKESVHTSPKGVADRGGEEATEPRKSSAKNREFDPDATLTVKQRQEQRRLMTQDIVFDDLETPCWRQRDTEMDTDILEKRAKHPMVIGQSPTSPPGHARLGHIRETDSARAGDPRTSFEFGAGLAIFGEKPVSQLLDEHQNAGAQR